jgi:hypothetical protein
MSQSIVDQVYEKYEAIEVPWSRRHPGARFRWRIGHAAFDEIAEAAAGPRPSHIVSLREFGERFARLEEKQDREWAERIRSFREGWGSDGASLLGWPVVCDESFEGVELEVAAL